MKQPTNSTRTKFISKKQAIGKENESNFEDETKLICESAAENFFMQGKNAEMTKSRKSKKIVCHESYSDVEIEYAHSDKSQYSLQSLSNFVENASKQKSLYKVKRNFSYFTNVYLESGFNICFIGAGSKNKLLEEYAEYLIGLGEAVFTVEGYKEEVSVRALLQTLFDKLKLKKDTGRDIMAWSRKITDELEKKKLRIFVLFHNIDSVDLRDPTEQRALATLSSTHWIRLITSFDHLKTTIMWDSECTNLFNFVFLEQNTFDFSLSNLIASKSNILGLNPKNSTSAHTIASLDILWQSLAENAKKIFHIFFEMSFRSGQSVPFWDLFATARDEFLVSTDAALRQLLVEFEDHRILNRRRRDDGNESLIPCIDKQLVEKFLIEKGIPLEI